MFREDVSKEKTEMQYLRVFSKKDDDFVRYWASVSTEKVDKDNKPTGKYARANISVRLSADAAEVFKKNCVKTKTKGIKQLNCKIGDAWLKASEPKDGEAFVYLFVNSLEPAEQEEEEDD